MGRVLSREGPRVRLLRERRALSFHEALEACVSLLDASFSWKGAVLCGTMSRLRVSGACPSPLPVLLPLEKGRGDTRLGSGERSRAPTPPLAPPRRFPVSSGLDLVVSSLHRLIGTPHNEAAFPTPRAPPPPRHHQTFSPLRLIVSPPLHPLFLSFSLWRRDAGSGVRVGVIEGPGTLLFSGPCGVRLFPWRGAVLCGTMSRLPVTEACPSPLPILLPLEKGRGDTRLVPGERSRTPHSPRLAVSPSPQVWTSSSLPFIDSSAAPTTRPPSQRHEHPLHPGTTKPRRLSVSPFLRFPASPSPQVSTSSSLPLIDSSAPPTTRPPSQRHEHPLHPGTTKPRRFPIPSSCPSPSGEGTQGLACGSEPSKDPASFRSRGFDASQPPTPPPRSCGRCLRRAGPRAGRGHPIPGLRGPRRTPSPAGRRSVRA